MVIFNHIVGSIFGLLVESIELLVIGYWNFSCKLYLLTVQTMQGDAIQYISINYIIKMESFLVLAISSSLILRKTIISC